MVRSNDPFWNDVEDMNNGGMKCKFCGHLFAENTSISRIKWHLSGVKGRGVKICEKVPEEVRNVVRAEMDGPPEKKLKTIAGSSNNEVTNTILASVQEQNNDEVMAQEGDALFVGEPEHWLTSFTDEDFELLRGSSSDEESGGEEAGAEFVDPSSSLFEKIHETCQEIDSNPLDEPASEPPTAGGSQSLTLKRREGSPSPDILTMAAQRAKSKKRRTVDAENITPTITLPVSSPPRMTITTHPRTRNSTPFDGSSNPRACSSSTAPRIGFVVPPFPSLSQEEKKALLSFTSEHNSIFGGDDMQTVDVIEKLSAMPSDISQMSDDNFARHLDLAVQLHLQSFLMSAHSRSRWSSQRSQMRAALAQAREDREEVNALREANIQLEAQMREDKKAYRKLEEDRIYQASQLSSAQGRVHLAEESNTSLRQSFRGLETKILILMNELATAKADARASREECARMRALRDSPDEFLNVFGGSPALELSIADKVFTTMSNLHFYNLAMGFVSDFSVAFDPLPVPNFAEIHPVRAAAAARGKYLKDEPED